MLRECQGALLQLEAEFAAAHSRQTALVVARPGAAGQYVSVTLGIGPGLGIRRGSLWAA